MLLKITKTKKLRMIDSTVCSLRSQWTSIFIGVSDYVMPLGPKDRLNTIIIIPCTVADLIRERYTY